MPFGVGQWEIIVLVAVLVLLFGSSRVPKIARDLGRSVREIKETVEGVDPRTPLKELERGPTTRPRTRNDERRNAEQPWLLKTPSGQSRVS